MLCAFGHVGGVNSALEIAFMNYELLMVVGRVIIPQVSLSIKNMVYCVILTYEFNTQITPPTKIAGLRFILAICEKTVRDIEITLTLIRPIRE